MAILAMAWWAWMLITPFAFLFAWCVFFAILGIVDGTHKDFEIMTKPDRDY